MNEELHLTGMVLQSAPFSDYDRRVVLLTGERGKITAFARGARRPTSTLLAGTVTFNFGTFSLYEGRSAYTMTGAAITNYFTKLKSDLDGSLYGAYFCELAGYYGRENLEASAMLNLLYISLRALEKGYVSDRLVRYIYEIRLMVMNGEFPQDAARDRALLESTRYALNFIIGAPLQKLYTFTVSDEVFDQIRKVQDPIRNRTMDRRLRSLEILEQMEG